LEIGQVDFAIERACQNGACRQPIELNQENIQRADRLHRQIRALNDPERFNFMFQKAQAPDGMADLELVREYVCTFSDDERSLLNLEADQKETDAILKCCEKVYKRVIVGIVAVAAAAIMAEAYFTSR
jgi:hypothetical protein